MSTRTRFAIALASIALAASPAYAGDGKHKGHKGHKGDQVHVVDGRHDNGLHKGWYKQAWKRGDRIPVAYLEPVYYVDDYRVYHLSAPPTGYRWVRPMDDRYLLVELATGLVTQALGY
jgi:Ni/Co efflux regulator RcnB